MSWPEVIRYKEQNAHELLLSGPAIDERLRLKDEVDSQVFKLTSLNYLDISSTILTKLPDNAFDNLPNLINLVLRNNKLTAVPSSIERLQKLRVLDVSSNCLTEIPPGINKCAELYILNVRGNQLESLPPLGQGRLGKLAVLDFSNNRLSEFPEDLTCLSLSSLSEIHAQNNAIVSLPASIKNVHALKLLNLEGNVITVIPPEVSLCVKLKEINVKGNRLTDRRLYKMIEGSSKTSSIVEYLHKMLPKPESSKSGKGGGKAGSAKKKAKARSKSRGERSRSQSPAPKNMHNIFVHPPVEAEQRKVGVTSAVLMGEVRPHILCCVVEDVDLRQTNNLFKRFITAQTKLHDTVCQKRLASTIATHDAESIHFPLTYDARNEKELFIQPLMRSELETAEYLKSRLLAEAEETRKKTKRNAFTGIHKYLDLVKDKDTFACLVANAGTGNEQVISFPPITNSDVTKISPTTTSIFLEVTSSTSLDAAKRTMDALVKEMLLLGLSGGSYDNILKDDGEAGEVDSLAASMREMSVEGKALSLKVRQVKVFDESTGNLRSVYPSNADLLHLDGIEVIRESKE